MELAATKTGMSIAKPARQRETSPGAGVHPRQEHGRVTPPQGGRPVSNKRATRPTRRVHGPHGSGVSAGRSPLPCCGARLGHFGCGLDHSPGEP